MNTFARILSTDLSNMSRKFLGGAISTASSLGSSRSTYLSSPCTPRRTPRSDRLIDVSIPFEPYSDEADTSKLRDLPFRRPTTLQSPQPSTSRQIIQVSVYDQCCIDHSSDSSFEDSRFLPRTPALITPSVLCYEPNVDERKLGTFSAINIILGKTIGVGIFSVPSSIFVDVGSVGMSLLVWSIGAAISFCGLAVYLDFGTALPTSGGEKVYLERIFQKPRMLVTSIFMAYVILLGFSTPNCIVLGEYTMYALGTKVNQWNVRSVAVLAITSTCLIHARWPKLGLHTINFLSVGKMVMIAMIVLSGLGAHFTGTGGHGLMSTHSHGASYGTSAFHNRRSLFASSSTVPYDYATALLKVLYCFRGYNTANQVLSEIRNPVPTLRKAAPIALSIVSVAYLFVNVAYFCVLDVDDIRSSGLVVTGRFFQIAFGDLVGQKILPWLIILSAYGSIAATSFAQARVNQELAKEHLFPFGHFWASNEPWGTPASALLLHWLVSVIVIVAPPPGEIYNFLIEIGGYPVSVISVAVSAGLLYLKASPSERWQSPRPARLAVVAMFLLSNLLLLILPWIPPKGDSSNSRFAYYAYPATGLAILASGVVYWFWWTRLEPWWFSLEAQIIKTAITGGDIAMQDWKSEVVEMRIP